MSWSTLIPNSMAYLGSICLGLAIVLVLLDMPGGVNWSKIGAWCALVAGFGVLGGAGGWIGHRIMQGRDTATTFGERWGAQAIGSGALVVLLLAGGLWAYKHISSKGVDAGGKGKWAKRARSLLKAGVFAIVGAAIAALIPELYNGADWVVASIGDGIRHAIA